VTPLTTSVTRHAATAASHAAALPARARATIREGTQPAGHRPGRGESPGQGSSRSQRQSGQSQEDTRDLGGYNGTKQYITGMLPTT
jgi:hypothetical protein